MPVPPPSGLNPANIVTPINFHNAIKFLLPPLGSVLFVWSYDKTPRQNGLVITHNGPDGQSNYLLSQHMGRTDYIEGGHYTFKNVTDEMQEWYLSCWEIVPGDQWTALSHQSNLSNHVILGPYQGNCVFTSISGGYELALVNYTSESQGFVSARFAAGVVLDQTQSMTVAIPPYGALRLECSMFGVRRYNALCFKDGDLIPGVTNPYPSKIIVQYSIGNAASLVQILYINPFEIPWPLHFFGWETLQGEPIGVLTHQAVIQFGPPEVNAGSCSFLTTIGDEYVEANTKLSTLKFQIEDPHAA